MRRYDEIKHQHIYERMYKSSEKCTDKAVFNGVLSIITLPYKNTYTEEETKSFYKLSSVVYEQLKEVTPKQIMRVFPIHKEYDGYKYGEKDFYSTIEYLKDVDLEKPLGDKLEEFLWYYYNWDLMFFHIMHGSWERKVKIYEEDEKQKLYFENLKEKTTKFSDEFNDLNEYSKLAIKNIKKTKEKLKSIKEEIEKSKNIITKSYLKRKESKALEDLNTHKIMYNIFLEAKKELAHNLSKAEEWDLLIDLLIERNERETANEYIILRNELKSI